MNHFNKYIKPIFFVALGIYVFDQTRIWVSGGHFENFGDELSQFGLYFLYSFVIGSSNIWLAKQLDALFPWKEVPRKRAVYGVLGAVAVSMVSIIVLRLAMVILYSGHTWNYFKAHESLFFYFYSLIITLVVVLIFYVIFFYKSITKQTITAHQVVAKTETAKYETLKSQLDPHFLFNSLNVLTSLIEENPEKAEDFTTKLSKVYRYVLDQKDKDLVPLEQELMFARNYMELLQMRFEGALYFDIPDKISNPNYKVVPLALQMLLENAVKHNSLSIKSPLKISITEKHGVLTISNNTVFKETFTENAGIGLRNITERYALMTERSIHINESENHFTVQLPLLTQKTKILKMTTDTEKKYLEAREQVERIKEFYTSLISFAIVMPLLVYINYTTYWSYKWFVFPLIGWGIGLFFSYNKAFNKHMFLGQDWEKKKIETLFNEEQEEKWY